MNFKERKSLIERVAKKFHKDGIDHLKLVGNFEKYSPLFHFHISEPFKDGNFIYVTELFGNEIGRKNISGLDEGYRLQYQGNYRGLDRTVLLNIHGFSTGITLHPSFSILKYNPEFAKNFDNSLMYLKEITKFSNPETFKIDLHHEHFSSTFNI